MYHQHATVTHVAMSSTDLTVLERRLGRTHAICKRLRDALADCTISGLQNYRAAAQRHHRDGELEIDPGAVVSKGDDPGAYVMPWLWIDDSELASDRPKVPSSRRARRVRPQSRPVTRTAINR
jgi:hypothetical protein